MTASDCLPHKVNDQQTRALRALWMTSDCLPHQVTINKPELSARWGITLESKPQIGGAPKVR